jgi:outer membrane protein assembly factor BamB
MERAATVQLLCALVCGVWAPVPHAMAPPAATCAAPRWRFSAAGKVASAAAVSTDGSIYVGSYGNRVYRLDPAASGGVVGHTWAYDTEGAVTSKPALSLGGGVVYVGSYDRKLHAIETASGARRWQYSTGGYVVASPAVDDNDGTIYGMDVTLPAQCQPARANYGGL